ncbi:hypothetical protein CNECB9_2470002 [Cupriavidus necator]|uniref:Uncharacterized protein n=1 Tax=Cupriavidus necator TaxID=106590 RepID=A0A1K0IEC9_CUPNE|nr:hypothetical protein CNECB9_2470002 [Cupriavidus necator]
MPAMSRSAKDTWRSVHFAIMYGTAFTAYPLPYSKGCDTFGLSGGIASPAAPDMSLSGKQCHEMSWPAPNTKSA